MALSYEGLAFFKNNVKLACDAKQLPLFGGYSSSCPIEQQDGSLRFPSENLGCKPLANSCRVLQTEDEGHGSTKQNLGSSTKGAYIQGNTCSLDKVDMPVDKEGDSEGDLIQGSSKRPQCMATRCSVASRGSNGHKGYVKLLNLGIVDSQGESSLPGPERSNPPGLTGSAGYASADDGSDFESCAGSPPRRTQLSSRCHALSKEATDSPRSLSSSLSSGSSSERRMEALEVALAIKSCEIQRLAGAFAGTEGALTEREKEVQHLSALAKNLEEQIVAKDEILGLSHELISSLEERVNELEVQRGAFENRAGDYEQSILGLQAGQDRAAAELAGLQQERGALVQRNQELTGRVGGLEGQLKEKGQEIVVLEGQLEAAEKRAREQVEGLAGEMARLQNRVAETAHALRTAGALISKLQLQLQYKEVALRETKAERERALQAQAESLENLKLQIESLGVDVLRKDGNLVAVGAHVADLQRQLEEREWECSQAQENMSGLQAQLETERLGARIATDNLQRELETERALRLGAEAELEAKEVELEVIVAQAAKLRDELTANTLPAGQESLLSASSADPFLWESELAPEYELGCVEAPASPVISQSGSCDTADFCERFGAQIVKAGQVLPGENDPGAEEEKIMGQWCVSGLGAGTEGPQSQKDRFSSAEPATQAGAIDQSIASKATACVVADLGVAAGGAACSASTALELRSVPDVVTRASPYAATLRETSFKALPVSSTGALPAVVSRRSLRSRAEGADAAKGLKVLLFD